MIIQGSNKPIKITFDEVPADISITLHNEIQILKHWAMVDLTVSDDDLTYTAPITQTESAVWEEGPAEIEVRWMDDTGIVRKFVVHETVEHTTDSTELQAE